jgi:hypothetical protein
MDDEAQLQRLSVCRTCQDLADQISLILRDLDRVPDEKRTAFRRLPGTTFAQRHATRLYVAIAGAAVRVRKAEGILPEVPLDAADPRQGMLEILQWCSRSEALAEAVKGESQSDEEIGSPATVTPAVSCGCKEPSRIDNQAYLLYTSMGISQEGVAAKLTEEYHPVKPYRQYQIARMVNRVREYRRANGLPVDRSRPSGSHIAGDPAVFELGNRTDGKVGDPRHKRSQTAE